MNQENKSRDTLAQTGFSQTAERAPEDYYETPEWATKALLERESFDGIGLEPACGGGAISRVVEAYLAEKQRNNPTQIHRLLSSDIREDGIHPSAKLGCNFLISNPTELKLDFILTNPPFKAAAAFAGRSISLAPKVALFVRLQFLESQERYEFFKHHPPKKVYVFSSRVACLKDGKPQPAIMSFAWFVWDSSYKGKPEIEWIEPKRGR